MKICSLLIIAFTMIGCSACSKKTTSTTENTQTSAPAVQSSPKSDSIQAAAAIQPTAKSDSIRNNYRFVVSFYSIGEGTEGLLITKFEKFLADKSLKINKTIEYGRSPWGREGEVDFCMKLVEFSTTDQEKFIAEAKEVLASAKHVHFSENAACKQRKQRSAH